MTVEIRSLFETYPATVTILGDYTGKTLTDFEAGLGKYQTPGAFQAPDALTLDGTASATLTLNVGESGVDPTAGDYMLWGRFKDAPNETLTRRFLILRVITTGGTPISPAIDYVQEPVGETPGYVATVGSDGHTVEWDPPAGGGGDVQTVAGVSPDGAGNVPLTAANVGADASGAAATAQAAAIAAAATDATTKVAAEATARTSAIATQHTADVAAFQPIDADLTTIAALDATVAGALATDGSGWFRKTYAQLKTALGLGNVDNTSDVNKPVSTAQAAADALAAPKTTATIDLVDRTDNTTETVPAGTTTNCSTAGVTKTAPALAGSVGTPPLRWAVKNLAAGSITVAYPDQAGAAQSLTVLSGETRTFRQKSTLGWGVESGAVALATLDARYAVLASPAFSGSPTAPTQTAGDNSTKLATTGYVDTASGLLIPKSLVTTKGDLFVATGSAAVARHAVGSNDQVLAADSTQTDGVKWATPPYVGMGGKSGAYYGPAAVALGTIAPALNVLQAKLLVVTKSVSITQLLAEVTVAGTAGAVGRLGLWADGTDGYPSALIVDAGTIDCTTTGVKTVTVAQTLAPGRYWLSYVAQVATATVRVDTGRDTTMPSSNSSMTAFRQAGVLAGAVSGVLPGTFPATLSTSQDIPLVYVKVA